MSNAWRPSVDFDPTGTDGRRDLGAKEIALAKEIGDILFSHYPGYLWAVHVDLHGKYKAATVQMPVLMPAAAKYVIPSRLFANYHELRMHVIRAGGEILERYKIPRTGLKFGESAFLQARGRGLSHIYGVPS